MNAIAPDVGHDAVLVNHSHGPGNSVAIPLHLRRGPLNILVACERSQAVTIRMRDNGHNAWSCDLAPCEGWKPEWHLQRNVLDVLEGWDLIVAFPPCTHLASSGARWWREKKADGRQGKAVDFFMRLANADCPFIAIENPKGLMSTVWRKPDQIVYPWQFGEPEAKGICLWLRGLPLLVPTELVRGRNPESHLMPQTKNRAMKRSVTSPGIARAMANQWAPARTAAMPHN